MAVSGTGTRPPTFKGTGTLAGGFRQGYEPASGLAASQAVPAVTDAGTPDTVVYLDLSQTIAGVVSFPAPTITAGTGATVNAAVVSPPAVAIGLPLVHNALPWVDISLTGV